jgi:tetratricopeptide (TPR) repeat protein
MSRTKLSALLDGILEAGWLAAIVVTPLFFNIYSARVFEPDKLTTLRSIALVMSAIWLIRRAEEWAGRWRDTADRPERRITWRTPLVLPTLVTVLVYLLSTAFSVTPYISFFGSYQRLQGAFTTLSYIVIFFIVLDRMRTRAQVDRFITTLILNSLPIALYGFVQRSQRDPLPWGGDVTRRIASNMGNAIFVAAYLIMAVPPTLARIVDSFRAIISDEDSGIADVLRASAYIFILLVQVIAIYYTGSRGPLMGLLTSIGIWVLLGLIHFQRKALSDEEQAYSTVRFPRGLGKWLAIGAASLEIAALLGGVAFLIAQAFAPEGSSLPAIVAGVLAVLAIAGVWLVPIKQHQSGKKNGLNGFAALFEDLGRGVWFFLLGIAVAGATGGLLFAASAGATAFNSLLSISSTVMIVVYVITTIVLIALGVWLISQKKRVWGWLAIGTTLLSALALVDLLLGEQVNLALWVVAIGALLAYLATWLTFIINRWGWRWLWASALVLGVIAAGGFFAINPGGPFHEQARENPGISRLSRVLEAESGTGKVRSLIWLGALDMIIPHEPIQSPPTLRSENWKPDTLNAIRPIVGYGPEAMYVAYNSFYPPLLGHYESRTASPDRSHNETLDSVIITGSLGLGAYVWIFGAVFYLGLKWLGLIPSDWRRILFFALLAGLAAIASIVVAFVLEPHFIALAIPAGIGIGLLIYLAVYAISLYWSPAAVAETHPHTLMLGALTAMFLGHFVEINFGIAIASTRTTFWAMAAIFVLLGLKQIIEREEVHMTQPEPRGKRRKRRRRSKPSPQPTPTKAPRWLWPTLGIGVIGALILGTLAYDFVNNVEQLSETWDIFWRSLTVIAIPQGDPPRTSLGILMVFAFAWVMTALLSVAQMIKRGLFQKKDPQKSPVLDQWTSVLIILAVSALVGAVIFGLVLAGRHAHVIEFRDRMQTVNDVMDLSMYIAGQINVYYVFLIVVIFLGGLAFMWERQITTDRWLTPVGGLALVAAAVGWFFASLIRDPTSAAEEVFRITDIIGPLLIGIGVTGVAGLLVYVLAPNAEADFKKARWAWALGAAGAVALFLAPILSYQYNLRPIRADIVYKQADPWDRAGQWHAAVPHYEKAIELAPREDFYYLYLGRAFLEYSSSLEEVSQQDLAMRQTERVLLSAQDINPLNTDHSANLARMYRRWADLPAGAQNRELLGVLSSDYYEVATTLSPQNAILWNEWATLCYEILGDQDLYQSRIEQSLELDPEFEQTWLIWSDIEVNRGNLEDAAEGYRTALEIKHDEPRVWSALGRIYLQLGDNEEAIAALGEALELAPNSASAWENQYWLAYAYYQMGDLEQATSEGERALLMAPENRLDQIQQLLAQIQIEQSGTITETTP